MRADGLRSARRAYELGRLRAGLLRALPVAVMGAWALGQQADWATAVAAVGLWCGVCALHQWGGEAGRGATCAALLSSIPFATAQLAAAFGHVCTGSACYNLCQPLCLLSGGVAGYLLAARARRAGFVLFLGTGGALVAGVSQLGCMCAGAGSLWGVLAGLALPLWLRGLQLGRMTGARGSGHG